MDVTAVASVPRSRFDHPPVPLPRQEGGDKARYGGHPRAPGRGASPLCTPRWALCAGASTGSSDSAGQGLAEGSFVTAARLSVCAVWGRAAAQQKRRGRSPGEAPLIRAFSPRGGEGTPRPAAGPLSLARERANRGPGGSVAVHLPSNWRPGTWPIGPDSSQACLRHPERSAYRCFLPDLTGFTSLRRAGPSSLRPARTSGTGTSPRGGIRPRMKRISGAGHR